MSAHIPRILCGKCNKPIPVSLHNRRRKSPTEAHLLVRCDGCKQQTTVPFAVKADETVTVFIQ